MDLVGPSILVRNLTRLGTLRPFERAVALLQCRCSILLRRPQRAAQLADDRWLLLRRLQLTAERKQAIGLTGSSVLPSQHRTQSAAREPLTRLAQRSCRCGNLLIGQLAIHAEELISKSRQRVHAPLEPGPTAGWAVFHGSMIS